MNTYTHLMFLIFKYSSIVLGSLALVCMMLCAIFTLANWLVTHSNHCRAILFAVSYSLHGKNYKESFLWAAIDEQAARSEYMAGRIIALAKQHMPSNA